MANEQQEIRHSADFISVNIRLCYEGIKIMRIIIMKLCLMGLLFLAGNISASNEGESYICIAEHMVAFAFDERTKEWRSISTTPDHEAVALTDKFLVRPIRTSDLSLMGTPITRAYGVWLLGHDGPPFVECDEDFSEYQWLRCGMDYDINFTMNARSLRYMTLLHGDYFISLFDSDEDPGGSPMTMQIGTCHKI